MNIFTILILSTAGGVFLPLVNCQIGSSFGLISTSSDFVYSLISGLDSPVISVPQADGSVVQMSILQVIGKLMNAVPSPSPTVNFYLYTHVNQSIPETLYINSTSSLSSSSFDSNIPTRFIIHGWVKSYKSPMNSQITNALLSTGTYNVIFVDWSKDADTVDYFHAANSVPGVGLKLAQMIDFLHTSGGVSFADLKLIGHSLGAHVAGFAGKLVTTGRLPVIIGLDVAKPLFNYGDCTSRLCYTDADYVESIHTSANFWGFREPIGHAAFYANGGLSQPSCSVLHDLLTDYCSHNLAYTYYAESILLNDFKSVQCPNYTMAIQKACGLTYSSNARLGSSNNENVAHGSYYTPVGTAPPYGIV